MSSIAVVDVLLVVAWLIAGGVSLYFSFGNARIWTSISTGFFLIFVSQAYLLAPWVRDPRLAAIHSIVGTIAILALTHGFQEYYVFSRTMEAGGSKAAVYLTAAAAVVASLVFLIINPTPSAASVRLIRIIESSNWVFLSLINIDMIRKIYVQVRESPISRGFIAFAIVFAAIFLWKGSSLYLQVYGWDREWNTVLAGFGVDPDTSLYAPRIAFSLAVNRVAAFASSVAVGGTFVYMYRLLR